MFEKPRRSIGEVGAQTVTSPEVDSSALLAFTDRGKVDSLLLSGQVEVDAGALLLLCNVVSRFSVTKNGYQ